MGGVAFNSQAAQSNEHGPFGANNFEINNVKNYEDRLNINSLDGENLDERRESFEGADADIRETDADLDSEGRGRGANYLGQYQASYMRNTISRENHLASKNAYDYQKGGLANMRGPVAPTGFTSPGGVAAAGSSSSQQPGAQDKRNKSAYKTYNSKGQPTGGAAPTNLNDHQKSTSKNLSLGGALNTNFSVLSFDHILRQKNQGNPTCSQQSLVGAQADPFNGEAPQQQ